MPELLIGLLVGLGLAVGAGFDSVGALIVGGVAAVLAYAVSCVVFPFRRCWRCGGDDKQPDGRGNYRRKRRCWWCKGEKDNRRVGAWLLGRG